MSIDHPNEYEQAIEDYAAAVRTEEAAAIALTLASEAHATALFERHAAWRVVSAFVNDRKIKPGVYRIHRGAGLDAEALVIDPGHDYPPLLPMFR